MNFTKEDNENDSINYNFIKLKSSNINFLLSKFILLLDDFVFK